MTNERICPAARPSDGMYEVDTGDWKFEEPVVDPETCVECGRCYVFCPTKTIVREEEAGYYRVESAWCKGCGICIEVCPIDAIEMRRLPDETIRAEYEEAMGDEA